VNATNAVLSITTADEEYNIIVVVHIMPGHTCLGDGLPLLERLGSYTPPGIKSGGAQELGYQGIH
jgi:hypothetical protein